MDAKLIRKAVELADGWLMHGTTGFSTPESGHDAALDEIENMNQLEKDALAAQLVRQVDALEDIWVDSDPYGTAKVWSGSAFGVGDLARIEKANDEDRTMNTIKAIIDSGVLDVD